jgi:hypothetical protein
MRKLCLSVVYCGFTLLVQSQNFRLTVKSENTPIQDDSLLVVIKSQCKDCQIKYSRKDDLSGHLDILIPNGSILHEEIISNFSMTSLKEVLCKEPFKYYVFEFITNP